MFFLSLLFLSVNSLHSAWIRLPLYFLSPFFSSFLFLSVISLNTRESVSLYTSFLPYLLSFFLSLLFLSVISLNTRESVSLYTAFLPCFLSLLSLSYLFTYSHLSLHVVYSLDKDIYDWKIVLISSDCVKEVEVWMPLLNDIANVHCLYSCTFISYYLRYRLC